MFHICTDLSTNGNNPGICFFANPIGAPVPWIPVRPQERIQCVLGSRPHLSLFEIRHASIFIHRGARLLRRRAAMTGLAEASGDGAAIGDAVQRAERWPAASGICGHGRRIIVMVDEGARRGAGRCHLISAGFSWAPDSERQSRCRSRASRRYSRQGGLTPRQQHRQPRSGSVPMNNPHGISATSRDPPNGHPLPCPLVGAHRFTRSAHFAQREHAGRHNRGFQASQTRTGWHRARRSERGKERPHCTRPVRQSRRRVAD
jgi:hypothetical protein